MNSNDVVRRAAREMLHQELIQSGIVASCVNCENWHEPTERCALAPQAPVPIKVVIFGCSKWLQVIPF